MTAQQSSFERSVEEARLASEKREFCKFSHFIWSAFSECIKVYNQEKNFGVNITTEDKLKLFFTSVCAGLNRSNAAKISKVWVDAFWYHSLLDAGFIPKDEMDDIIDRLDEVPEILKQADKEKIKEKLKCMGLLETPSTKLSQVQNTEEYVEKETDVEPSLRTPRKQEHSTSSEESYVQADSSDLFEKPRYYSTQLASR